MRLRPGLLTNVAALSGGAPAATFTRVFGDSALLNSTSGSLALTGAAAGDWVVVQTWSPTAVTVGVSLAGTGSLTAQQNDAGAEGGANYRIYFAALTSTDAAGSVSISSVGGVTCFQHTVVRGSAGIASITLKQFKQEDQTSTTLALDGWTPAAKALAGLLMVIDRQNTLPTGGNPVLTDWTKDQSAAAGSTLRFYQFSYASYAGGAFTVTGLTNGASAPNGYNTGHALEVVSN
jgi:hypothetical protein